MSSLTSESLIARIDGLREEIFDFVRRYPQLHFDVVGLKFLPDMKARLESVREQLLDTGLSEVNSSLIMLYGTSSAHTFLDQVLNLATSEQGRNFGLKVEKELTEFLHRVEKTDKDILMYSKLLTNQAFENLPKNRVKEGIRDYITQQIIEPETGEVWDFFHGYFGLEYDEPNSDLCNKVEAYVKDVARRVVEEM